jgi:hypothetical protein
MPEIVIESKRDSRTGTITLTIDPGTGQIEYRKYRAIRGGLSWPTANSPGYYVIVGELAVDERLTRFEGVEIRRGKLHLLCERTVDSAFLGGLAEKLSDDAARYGATTVYTEIVVAEDGGYDERATMMRELLVATKRPVSLMRAPYTEDAKSARGESLQLSLSWVEEWIRQARLELPEDSLCRQQLKAISRSDLDDPDAEPRIYAARALGFVVSAFHKLGGHRGTYRPKREHRPPRKFGNRR